MIIINPWKQIRMLKAQAEAREEYIYDLLSRNIELESALWEVAGLDTPKAANTVKKAVRIAHKAIGWVS